MMSPSGEIARSWSFRGQAEAVKEPEDEHGGLHVGLKAEMPESIQVFERLVDHGKADDGVDEIGVGVHAAEHAQQQGRAVTHREQRHVGDHIAQSVQEEDNAGEKRQVIVPGHHVLGAEIDEGSDLRTHVVQQERLVRPGDAMGEGCGGRHSAQQQSNQPFPRAHGSLLYPMGARILISLALVARPAPSCGGGGLRRQSDP